jgi:hypothetical protein
MNLADKTNEHYWKMKKEKLEREIYGMTVKESFDLSVGEGLYEGFKFFAKFTLPIYGEIHSWKFSKLMAEDYDGTKPSTKFTFAMITGLKYLVYTALSSPFRN